MNKRPELNPERLTATWSRFWTNPYLTALPEAFPEKYGGRMLEFWDELLSRDVTHIVDLATGNGALVWMANEIQSRRPSPATITGIDLAAIDPFTALGRNPDDYPRVRFIGETSVDSLPFPDASVDIVISQYGVEYSDLEKTIAESARVLTSSGTMGFILHDRDSILVGGISNKLAHCQDMLEDAEFHALTEALIELIGRIKDKNELQANREFQQFGQQINAKVLQLKPRLDRYPNSSPLNQFIGRLGQALDIAADIEPGDRKRQSKDALETLRQDSENLAEVDAAALEPEDRERLASFIEQHGFRITHFAPMILGDGKNWGMTLVAKR